MSEIHVSVIIPCYNVDNYIEEGICSILNQTYTNFEVVCIDDCSTDNTYKILLNFSKIDSRVKVYKNLKNIGLVGTLNKLVEFATSDILIRMDPDDISVNYRIEKLVNTYIQTKSLVISSRYRLINKTGKHIPYKGYDILSSPNGIKFTSLFNSPIPHAPALIHKSIFSKFKYDKQYLAAEDYNLWVNLILSNFNDFVILKDVLYLYRIIDTSTSFINNSVQAKNHILISKKAINGILGLNYENLNVMYTKNTYERNIYTYELFQKSINELKEIKNLFIKKIKPTEIEIIEIKKYNNQHSVFLSYRFLKSMNFIEKIKSIKIILLNLNIYISFSSLKFLLKRIV